MCKRRALGLFGGSFLPPLTEQTQVSGYDPHLRGRLRVLKKKVRPSHPREGKMLPLPAFSVCLIPAAMAAEAASESNSPQKLQITVIPSYSGLGKGPSWVSAQGKHALLGILKNHALACRTKNTYRAKKFPLSRLFPSLTRFRSDPGEAFNKDWRSSSRFASTVKIFPLIPRGHRLRPATA